MVNTLEFKDGWDCIFIFLNPNETCLLFQCQRHTTISLCFFDTNTNYAKLTIMFSLLTIYSCLLCFGAFLYSNDGMWSNQTRTKS